MLQRATCFIIGLVCCCQWAMVKAGPLEDYYEAREIYIDASACLATYDDYLGRIALDALVDTGWHIQHYKQVGDKADARFLSAVKDIDGNGQIMYLLAAAGTETKKDVLTDFMVDKVYFSGQTPEEMISNAAKKDVPPTVPMIHRGFYQYLRTALAIAGTGGKDQTKGLLFDEVVKHPDRKIYLVGHSLGGAAVTVSAAALINFGARPEQLKVITFGAPAVGNEAFRTQYGSQIDLTRVVMRGDSVTGVLQGLVGGYAQIGKAVTWSVPDNYDYEPHSMVLYLDKAIKNYYQTRQLAIEAGVLSVENKRLPNEEQQPFVYVSPVVNNLPEPINEEFYYMKEALLGKYRNLFPAYVFVDGDSKNNSTSAALKAATVAGCQWLVVPEFQEEKLKDEKNAYHIVFQQTVYRVADGRLLSLETYSSGTQKLTPVEAGIHGVLEMSSEKAPWLQ